ncbi:hypothetical protein NDU88_003569 [Pleurodeles waltl]|uniref:Uncharacterized protein n=1 Tax=Pleurodeles waltl TaxID=8319 RepID=A0AAV7NK85_PLEWA|nr:hypothetical protein NDU88_003569 [Pleurodeles waltl]
MEGDARSPPLPLWRSSSPLLGRVLRPREPRCASEGPGPIAPAISCSLQWLFHGGDARGPPLPLRRSSSPLLGPVLRLHKPCCASAGQDPIAPAISCSPRWLLCGGDVHSPLLPLWRSSSPFLGPVLRLRETARPDVGVRTSLRSARGGVLTSGTVARGPPRFSSGSGQCRQPGGSVMRS